MQTLVAVSWLVMMAGSLVVMTVAMGLWFRDVLRGQDTDGVEPSPVSVRSALYSLLAGLAFCGTRWARGEPLSFKDVAFHALLIGFALSAGWYLLARRSTKEPNPGKVAGLSAVIAASFGTLSALTPP